jgi:hypothetical protein
MLCWQFDLPDHAPFDPASAARLETPNDRDKLAETAQGTQPSVKNRTAVSAGVHRFVRRHPASVLSRGEASRTRHLAEVQLWAVQSSDRTKLWEGSNGRRQC